MILPVIRDKGLMGRIEIILNEPLAGNSSSAIKEQMISLNGNGRHHNDIGEITLALEPSNNAEIDMNSMFDEMLSRKPHDAHGTVFAEDYKGLPVNPIEIMCRCKKSDKLLINMREKLSKASKEQLKNSKPGLIACFIEEIDDFTELAKDSGLALMTQDLFRSEERNHLAAIVYSSDTNISVEGPVKHYNEPALLFRNPNCKFPIANDYKFLK